MKVHLARLVVWVAALLAPAPARARFVREWEAELWHAARRNEGGVAPVLTAALGAFADARALRAMIRRSSRGATMLEWVRGWGKDFRTAVRGLVHSPSYTAVAVVTLALGIGGTAAIGTLLDRVVLDPLPYPAAERMIRLRNQVPGVGPGTRWNLSTAQWLLFSDESETLEAVGLYRLEGGNLQTPAGPRRVLAAVVTASTMELLGARPRAGRVLTRQDDLPGAPAIALLSHGLWERGFGGDPGVVGRTLTLDGASVEIVGVMEPGVDLPEGFAGATPDLWLPMQVDRAGPFWPSHVFPGLARMAPGVTVEDVESEMERLTPRLPESFPNYSQAFLDRYGLRTEATLLKQDVVGELSSHLWILFGAVLLVLVIACANVTNLFIVRLEGRRRELAIRSALGAGRAALARHLLAEGVTVALAGGVLGLMVGVWAIPALTALAPTLPRVDGVEIGADTALLSVGLSLLVGIVLAAYPLMLHAGSGAVRRLADAGRSTTPDRGQQRLRSTMVVIQVAMAVTLLVGAGLLVETLRGLHRTDLGFEPRGVLTASLTPSFDRYASEDAFWGLYQGLLQRVRSTPGVVAAGMTSELPVQGGFGCTTQSFEDEAVVERIRDAGLTTCAGPAWATPGYFEAMGIPVLGGRTFTASDVDSGAPPTVVVSRAFADRFWPGEDPIGKGVASEPFRGEFHRVVGVVGDVPRSAGEGRPPLAEAAMALYYPRHGATTLVVKTDAERPEALFPILRRLAAEADPDMPVSELADMESIVAEALAERAFVSLLLGIAAAVALLLSAIGLYGVIAYVVSRRTREIGMRMAMGARPGEVQRMIVGRSLALVALGLATGVALALATTRVMQGLLVGVEPTSPTAFGAAVVLLAAVALLASWIPARRASRVDPSVALRVE